MNWKTKPKINKELNTSLKEFDPIVRQLLFNRKIEHTTDARAFFDEEEFEDFNKFNSIKAASDRIIKAIKSGEKIIIHGDYDVDGVTSSALLWDYIVNYQKGYAEVFIPNRFVDGYGMKVENIKKYIVKGFKLVITVDCGVKDHTIVDEINSAGVDVIITDHHIPEESYPNALALIHPSNGYSFRELSGVAVVWKLICYIEKNHPTGIDVEEFLDLVALGTICDLMPLIGENRSIVKKGLKVLSNTKRIGLINLIKDSGLSFSEINTYHVGYIIGPKLNASGRLESALSSFNLLTTDQPEKARDISTQLNDLNAERQQITLKATKEALDLIDYTKNIFIIKGSNWPEGIIGLVAGKILEATGKPAVVLTKKDDYYVGSCRSPEGVNIIELLKESKDLLISYGGHAQAAGLKISKENIKKFKEDLEQKLIDEKYNGSLEKSLDIDMEIKLSDVNWDLLGYLKKFEPFGIHNPTPTFSFSGVRVVSVQTMGADKKHLRLKVSSNKSFNETITCIGFSMGYFATKMNVGDVIDIAGSIEENVWNGSTSKQIKLKDIHI